MRSIKVVAMDFEFNMSRLEILCLLFSLTKRKVVLAEGIDWLMVMNIFAGS